MDSVPPRRRGSYLSFGAHASVSATAILAALKAAEIATRARAHCDDMESRDDATTTGGEQQEEEEEVSPCEDDWLHDYRIICVSTPVEHCRFGDTRLEAVPIGSGGACYVLGSDWPPPPREPLTPTQFYDRMVTRTPEECARELAAPQKSVDWLRARSLCLTGSMFGTVRGHNPYQTSDKFLREKLWGGGSVTPPMVWGTSHEPRARECFTAWMTARLAARGARNVVFSEENLMKFALQPWVGVSPDGLLAYDDVDGTPVHALIEYKCPARDRDSGVHPYRDSAHGVPQQYMDQVQGIMGLLRAHHPTFKPSVCWFGVWTPRRMWFVRIPFRPTYYDALADGLGSFFFMRLLPALTMKWNEALQPGDIAPRTTL